jgi:hypothetical protein
MTTIISKYEKKRDIYKKNIRILKETTLHVVKVVCALRLKIYQNNIF